MNKKIKKIYAVYNMYVMHVNKNIIAWYYSQLVYDSDGCIDSFLCYCKLISIININTLIKDGCVCQIYLQIISICISVRFTFI